MTAPRLGNRKVKLALGWILGCVLGVVLALPFALWLSPTPPRARPSADRVMASSLGVAAVFGGALGMSVMHLRTTLPAGRRRTALYAALGALGGSLLGGQLAALCYLDFTPQIELPLIFLVVFTLVGAVLGLLAGTGAAEEREEHERDIMLRKLDAQRVEREAPLNESRRETIKPGDADHLTEARRFEEAEP
jgi:hypothetical protein